MFYKNIKGHAEQFLNGYKQQNPATYAAAQEAIGGLLILDGFIGIDNPFGGKKRSGIFGSLIGVVVGLFFIFGVGFFANLIGINKMTATTTATVVSVSQPTATTRDSNGNTSGGSCTPTALYTVDGKDYTQTSRSGSSGACSLTQGQTIAINYDPNNPGAWAYDLNTIKTALKFFPVVGILFTVVSLVTFAIRLLSIIFGWKLLQSGRALAKTLPTGTDMTTIKNEIRQNFAKSVFGIGGGIQALAQMAPVQTPIQPQAATPPQNPTPPQYPTPPQPPVNPPTV